ncbi:uncharacterized protein LAESUDRAFT_611650, partial [Laetiporus sulphureus 93-53]
AKKLVRYLDGRDKEPTAPTAPGVDSDADEAYADAYDTWAAGHEAIKTLLYQTLPETLKLRIIPEKKVSGAWKVVIAEYDNRGDFVQAELLRRMHALHCTEEKDPRPTLDKLQKLKAEFTTAGGVLDDKQYRVLIISCLPESYRPVFHRRMAHAYAPALKKMVEANVVTGVRLEDTT